VFYGVKAGSINSTSPGVLFYFTRVTAPAASFTIDIAQTNSNGSVPLFGVQQGNQINLFNADCTSSNLGAISDGNGQAKIIVNGAIAGQVFIVQVKYSTQTVGGTLVPSPTTVHYNFATKVNGTQVDQDPDGVNLTQK
jgi:hypothetical protein